MPTKRKLVFINTHPIQYFAPLYREIEREGTFDLEVWYCTRHGLDNDFDKEFGTHIKWDIPVLQDYNSRFFKNHSWKPGIYNGYFGVINWRLAKALFKLTPNSIVVVHGWFPFSATMSIILSKLNRHVTCLRAEPPLVHEFTRSRFNLFLRKIVLKYILFRFVDRFLYIGEQNRRFYKFYDIVDSKLFFAPYAVDNDFFTKKASFYTGQRSLIRKNLSIPEDSVVILISGKLIPKKRPIDLLKAFQIVQQQHPCFLVFMGDGELRTDIETHSKINNLENILITGFINQSRIPEYYYMADVFVMCSDVGETWGLSTNEAMNFSLPVIVSDLTGNFEDLVSGNGFVTKTGDITDLAEKLLAICKSSPEQLKAMKQRSVELVQNYSFSKILEGIKQAST